MSNVDRSARAAAPRRSALNLVLHGVLIVCALAALVLVVFVDNGYTPMSYALSGVVVVSGFYLGWPRRPRVR